MDHLLAARAQMGTSLAFHFIFSALGIGLPVLLILAEGEWLRTKDARFYRLARTWSRAMAVLFAVGAVSGTVLSFELGLLWPEFMRHAGPIIGIGFSAEGFAFFIEAIFVGIYLYGWDRLTPFHHWLCAFPIAISGAASSFFVVAANAWMNTPAGFRIAHGKAVDIDPWAAIANPAMPTEFLHTTLAAYVFTGFAVAAVYAFAALRAPGAIYLRNGLRLAMLLGAVAIPLQIVVGDLSARFDASAEPAKFAAMEDQYHTQAGAPLRIGGLTNERTETTAGAIEIPYLLSFLAREDPRATVLGLDTFAAGERPHPSLVHPAFDVMVGTGSTLLLLAGWWAWTTLRRRQAPGRWLLRALVASGPLAFLAMECGWMVTEEGRQPWIVHGFMKTSAAVTTAPALDVAFFGFSLLYVLLAASLVWLLLRIGRHGKEDAGTSLARGPEGVAA